MTNSNGQKELGVDPADWAPPQCERPPPQCELAPAPCELAPARCKLPYAPSKLAPEQCELPTCTVRTAASIVRPDVRAYGMGACFGGRAVPTDEWEFRSVGWGLWAANRPPRSRRTSFCSPDKTAIDRAASKARAAQADPDEFQSRGSHLCASR